MDGKTALRNIGWSPLPSRGERARAQRAVDRARRLLELPVDDEPQQPPHDPIRERAAAVEALGILEKQLSLGKGVNPALFWTQVVELVKSSDEPINPAGSPEKTDSDNVTPANKAPGELSAAMKTAKPGMPPHPLESLTMRQQSILDFLRSCAESQSGPPNLKAIGDAVGLVSPSTVEYQLRSLVAKGYLIRGDERWTLAAPEESRIIRRET